MIEWKFPKSVLPSSPRCLLLLLLNFFSSISDETRINLTEQISNRSLEGKTMAQFATQSSLKLLFNGEGVSSLLEQKDPFHWKSRSIQTRKRRLRYMASSSSAAGIYFPSTSRSRCNAEARPSDCVYEDDDSDDEFENDNLACFRGLVLDVSYRSLFPPLLLFCSCLLFCFCLRIHGTRFCTFLLR